MDGPYRHSLKSVELFGKMLSNKLTKKCQSPYFQREVGRELEISNSTVARIVNGTMDDVKMSTFIALCRYANFSDDEILFLYHMALDEDYTMPDECLDDKKILELKLKRIRDIIDE